MTFTEEELARIASVFGDQMYEYMGDKNGAELEAKIVNKMNKKLTKLGYQGYQTVTVESLLDEPEII